MHMLSYEQNFENKKKRNKLDERLEIVNVSCSLNTEESLVIYRTRRFFIMYQLLGILLDV
jgi:hypothetical protein